MTEQGRTISADGRDRSAVDTTCRVGASHLWQPLSNLHQLMQHSALHPPKQARKRPRGAYQGIPLFTRVPLSSPPTMATPSYELFLKNQERLKKHAEAGIAVPAAELALCVPERPSSPPGLVRVGDSAARLCRDPVEPEAAPAPAPTVPLWLRVRALSGHRVRARGRPRRARW